MIAEKGSAADGVLAFGTNVAMQSLAGSPDADGAVTGIPVVSSVLGAIDGAAVGVPDAVVDSVLGATDRVFLFHRYLLLAVFGRLVRARTLRLLMHAVPRVARSN